MEGKHLKSKMTRMLFRDARFPGSNNRALVIGFITPSLFARVFKVLGNKS
jgi:hypothetical protein